MSEFSLNPLLKGMFCFLNKEPYSKSKITKSGGKGPYVFGQVGQAFMSSSIDHLPFLAFLFFGHDDPREV